MCGIIGYTGKEPAASILYGGLTRLEYRGYDSAGIATVDNNKIHIVKDKGKLGDIAQKCNETTLPGQSGLDMSGGQLMVGQPRKTRILTATMSRKLPWFITV